MKYVHNVCIENLRSTIVLIELLAEDFVHFLWENIVKKWEYMSNAANTMKWKSDIKIL